MSNVRPAQSHRRTDSDGCSCQSTGSEESCSLTDDYPSDTTTSSTRSSLPGGRGAPHTVLSGWNFYSSHHSKSRHHSQDCANSKPRRGSSSGGSSASKRMDSGYNGGVSPTDTLTGGTTTSQEPFFLHEPNMTSDDRVKKLFDNKTARKSSKEEVGDGAESGIAMSNGTSHHHHNGSNGVVGNTNGNAAQIVTVEVHHSSASEDSVSDVSDPLPDYDDQGSQSSDKKGSSREASSLSTDEGIYHEGEDEEDEDLEELMVPHPPDRDEPDDEDEVHDNEVSFSPHHQEDLVAIRNKRPPPEPSRRASPTTDADHVDVAPPPPPPPPPPKAPPTTEPPLDPPSREDDTSSESGSSTKQRFVKASAAGRRNSHQRTLPFIPPQFGFPPDSNENIRPSEYLRQAKGSTLKSSNGGSLHRAVSMGELAARPERISYGSRTESHETLLDSESRSRSQQQQQGEVKPHAPLSATNSKGDGSPLFNITVEQLQTVHLKKTDKPATPERTVLLQKNDLIAELKQTKDIQGVRKMKEERSKIEEVITADLAQTFKAEKFVDQIPEVDANGCVIPPWKRQMLAKKAAEKAKKEAEEQRLREAEAKKLNSIPPWKRQLLQRKDPPSPVTMQNVHRTVSQPVTKSPEPALQPEPILAESRPVPSPDHPPQEQETPQNGGDPEDIPPNPWLQQLRKTKSVFR